MKVYLEKSGRLKSTIIQVIRKYKQNSENLKQIYGKYLSWLHKIPLKSDKLWRRSLKWSLRVRVSEVSFTSKVEQREREGNYWNWDWTPGERHSRFVLSKRNEPNQNKENTRFYWSSGLSNKRDYIHTRWSIEDWVNKPKTKRILTGKQSLYFANRICFSTFVNWICSQSYVSLCILFDDLSLS